MNPETARLIVRELDRRLRVESVEPLAGGENSAVYEIRCAGGPSLVLKVYSDLLHWKLEKEVFAYGLVRTRVDLPVPEILGADETKRLVPRNYVVMTKLDGVLWADLLGELDEREHLRLTRELGSLLRKLHEIELDAFGYVTTRVFEPHRTNLEYMRTQFEKKLARFGERGGDAALRRALERHVAEREELLAGCLCAVFCHDDCHEANVLVAQDGDDAWRITGIVDFENAVAGDPLLDLAKTHAYSRRRSDRTLAALVDGYGELRDGWRDALALYELYHSLELWVWFADLGRMDELPAIADELRVQC
ncbi:MAG: aminoglycoside phosphotransferase family protein [Actinomycetota bacterium]|nr:aminoglycoside phosphotransferase family protein [Actinomycetota bacterium]